MAIHPICDQCKKELSEFGAILLGPPNENGMVRKRHLCVECYEEYVVLIEDPVAEE